jgi:hypothetical protein
VTEPKSDGEKYLQRKSREAAKQRKQSEAGRDIGKPPLIKVLGMREPLADSLRLFCEYCFPEKFARKWSPDHLKALAKMETAIKRGDLFALAMPRGTGKTTMTIAAVIWAIVCGHRKYCTIIGPTQKHAVKLLKAVKTEFETNERLHGVFPEATYAVRALARVANRCNGQLAGGQHTYIQWGQELIVLASVSHVAPEAKCSGAIVEAIGITGSVRGANQVLPNGMQMRPDLAIIDDPQTKQSARSPSQVEARLEVIAGDILGLAGPGQPFAAFTLCTVVEPDDAADRLLNRETHPDWQGDRFQLLYKFPDDWTGEATKGHWAKYSVIRSEELAAGRGLDGATEYYRQHQDEMDAGADVAWPERYEAEKGEISGLQHAMNLFFRNEHAFWSEYQNTPKRDDGDTDLLTVEQIEAKQSGYGRGIVPPDADTITAFIDVQQEALYWVTMAWRTSDFTGWVIDYGAWPDQGVPYFTLHSLRKTISQRYTGGLEARIRAALRECTDHLLGKEWLTATGSKHRIARLGIDGAWGKVTRTVQAVTLESPHAANLLTCFGRSIKPDQRPMEAWQKKPGERRGPGWIVRPTAGTHGRHAISDADFWKAFWHARLSTSDGDPGSVSLFRPQLRTQHRMFAEHQRAEKMVRVPGNERTKEMFTLPPNQPDNHYLDCAANCCMLASLSGAALRAYTVSRPKVRKAVRHRVSYL